MTPAEHLAEAERLLAGAYPLGDTYPAPGDRGLVQGAIAHALIAAAAELGVPHADTTTGGAGATPQSAAG